MATNDVCNVAHWDTFVSNGVQSCTCWRAFQGEAEQPSSIEAMHRRPAVRSITWIPRYALRARNVDQLCGKTMIALAMD